MHETKMKKKRKTQREPIVRDIQLSKNNNNNNNKYLRESRWVFFGGWGGGSR